VAAAAFASAEQFQREIALFDGISPVTDRLPELNRSNLVDSKQLPG